MRRFGLMTAVLFGAAVAFPGDAGADIFRRWRRNDGAGGGKVLTEVYPASGDNVTDMAGICSHADFSKSGNWWCLNADGSSDSGGASLSGSGSPSLTSGKFCPNGPDCLPEDFINMDGVDDRYATGNLDSPAGDFSTCATVRLGNETAGALTTKHGPAEVFQLYADPASTGIRFGVFKTAVSSTHINTTTGIVSGATYFVCGTYDYVGDGTSVMRLYINGTEASNSSAAVGPPQAGSTTPFRVGSRSADLFFKGAVRGALYTESLLSPTAVANLSKAALGAVSGSGGYELSFSRASVASMEDSNGAVHWVNNNRIRHKANGMLVEGQSVNLALQNRAFDNASWQKIGVVAAAPSVAANSQASPEIQAPTTAERVTYPSVIAAQASYLRQDFTATAAPYTASVWLKRSTGSGTVYLFFFNGVADYRTAACSITTAWSRCLLENQTLTAATWRINIGVDRNDGSQSNPGAQDVDVWGAQVEQSARVSSLIATAGTTVTRSADAGGLTFAANPLSGNPSKWCIRMTVTPYGTRRWDDSGAKGVFAIGTDSQANTSRLYLGSGSFDTTWEVSDSTPATRTLSQNAASGATGAHEVRVCYLNGLNSGKIHVDDVELASTLSGAGSGNLSTLSGTFYLGSTSNSVNPIWGFVKNVCVGKGSETVCQ